MEYPLLTLTFDTNGVCMDISYFLKRWVEACPFVYKLVSFGG